MTGCLVKAWMDIGSGRLDLPLPVDETYDNAHKERYTHVLSINPLVQRFVELD
jgi:hypothetical protein